MKISLLIPAYNEEKYLGDCLSFVEKNGRALFEVIVIDNASTDRTAEIAKSFPFVRVVHESKKGLTQARECGLRSASGDVIAFIDADTKMPSGWVERMIRVFSEDKNVVCLSGPYIYYDLPFYSKFIVWIYWIFFAWPTYFVTGYMAVGGNFAARKDALEKIGGFDQSISFYGEDTDIARRLHSVGTVKFLQRLYMPTSARRLKEEGLFITGYRYVINFFSIVLFKKPATSSYNDIR